MQFVKTLHSRIKSGEITTSIRIWKSQRVTVGKQYRLDDGWIMVSSVKEISLNDVTAAMARESGFSGLVELLRVAKHGKGENVYFIEFKYLDSTDRNTDNR